MFRFQEWFHVFGRLAVLLNPDMGSVVALWNTTAGDNGIASTPGYGSGNYNPNETPFNAFDCNVTSKYVSYGTCNGTSAIRGPDCGLRTGLHFTVRPYPTLLTSFRFATGNDNVERDPLTVTIEGSNGNRTNLLLGSAWNLIYNGSSGLVNTTNRLTFGDMQQVPNNGAWYTSYRLLVTSQRGNSNSVQYGTLEFYGYYY